MKNAILRSIFVLVSMSIASAIATAQQTPVDSKADFLGSINGDVYQNAFFGLEVTIPKGWKIADKETTDATMQVGADFMKGRNERSNKAIEDAVVKDVIVLHISKKPVGAIENATFTLGVRKQLSDSVTPSMVAEATKSVLINSPNLKLLKDTRLETVASRKFAVTDYLITAPNTTAWMRMYVTMIDGYAVSFAFGWVDEAHLKELEAIVASMRSTKK